MRLINFLSDYIKNIAAFLIFITLIGIISPSSKYKNYISLILGFILIFVLLSPLSAVFNKNYRNLDNLLIKMSADYNKNILEREVEYYSDEQNKKILDLYREEIEKQIKMLLENQKDFFVGEIEIAVNETEEDFGKIEDIFINLSRKETEKQEKKKLIRIEKIVIEPNNNLQDSLEEADTIETENLKNLISDFYNLSGENIHITVQKNIKE